MTGKLSGKVAYVTGGAGGIGRGIVERFVADGAKVVIGDVDIPTMDKLASDLGDNVATCAVDVTVEADVERLVATTVERFGRLDIAVNNAIGMAAMARTASESVAFWEQDTAAWQGTAFSVMFPVFLGIKHASRQMVAQGSGGSIINTSSIDARQTDEGMSSYCAGKAGLEMLVRCAAMELGPQNVRVNAIAPGLVLSPGAEAVLATAPALAESFRRNTPLGRHGRPADIGAAASFLASDDAAWITAETLTVDGGQLTRESPRRLELAAAHAH